MEAVPVEKMDVAQLDSSGDDNDDLHSSLRPKPGENRSEKTESSTELDSQPYEYFVSVFFSGLVSRISAQLKSGERSPRLAPMLHVCLDLIRDTASMETKVDRARQLTREMGIGISHLLQKRKNNDGNSCPDSLWSVISCVRAAQLLMLPREADFTSLSGDLLSVNEPTSNSNPEVLCDTHQIPAVRRRSANGRNKDRRFYVCGKDRGQRCAFFKWADELDSRLRTKTKAPSQLRHVVLENLWVDTVNDMVPLNVTLCRFLEAELFSKEDTLEITSNHLGHPPEKVKGERLGSLYDDATLRLDVDDGVLCSRDKLSDTRRGDSQTEDPSHRRFLYLDLFGTGDPMRCLLETSLSLLAMVADYRTPGISRWFSLLCEIENSSGFGERKEMAQKVLKSLCGKKRALFQSIRDHFSFAFQFQALFRNAGPLLETALLVREKARVCSPNWAVTSRMTWSSLSYGGLIGCDSLISENDYPESRLRAMEKILDSILALVRNDTESWRRFCGHSTLPSVRDHTRANPDLVFAQKMAEIPPIVVLFWVACSLSGESQVKAFKLIDVAITKTTGKLGISSLEGEVDTAIMLTINGSSTSTPESLLSSTPKRLSVEDMASFGIHFVLQGVSSDHRRVCQLFAEKMAATMSRSSRTELFTRLLSSVFLRVGEYGKSSNEFFSVLQSLVPDLDPSLSFGEYGDLLLESFVNQIEAVMYDRSNAKSVVIDSGPSHPPAVKKKLDLTECLNCLRIKPTTGVRDKSSDSSSSTSSRYSKRLAGSRAARQAKKWRQEQVSTFTRQRIDSIRAGSSSNEFNTFHALKHRVVISDMFLSVSDPRGRFVKGVSFYYSPYPAKDAAELKSDEYAPKWQKCASLVLPRNASRASAALAYPVVAANIRIEYTDFYERPGGSKASDGTLLVHCPRCTRGTLINRL